ncbi:amidohydrolase [Desulfobacterales bacterium HSG16]|nr:amidohydrolase [Desulfobacterales bacterium HSG16]
MKFDTVIYNGLIVTVNPEFDIIERGMVCIGGQTILEVRPMTDNAPLPDAHRLIDACGGIVMPGLINTHTHLPMSLFRGLADDLPLMEWLNDYMFPAEAKHINHESVRYGSLLSCGEMMLSGTTTCCDGYFIEDEVAKAVHKAGIRAVLGHGVIDFPAPGVPDPEENVRTAADYVKKWKNKYPLIYPSIFCHSPYTCSAKTLVKAKETAVSEDILFQIHAAETRTERLQTREEHNKTPVGYLDDLGILDEKTLLVHAVWVDPKDIELISGHGSAISIATESEMKLSSGIAPVQGFIDAGIRVGLGTDGCASNNNLDMFQEMDMTSKIQKVNCLDPTVLDAASVLKLATIEGARSIGLDDRIGSIEPGKDADLIIIDTNAAHMTPLYTPVSHLVYSGAGAVVRDVMVAGRMIVENRKITTFDIDEVMDRTASIAEGIFHG